MSDQPEPPRVHVTLPGGRQTTGRLHRWRQGPDRRWWAEVTVHVPAGAVGPLDGEQYDDVPREPAKEPEEAPPEFVLAVDTRQHPPTAVMHAADCWTIAKTAQWTRITALPTADDARAMLKFPDTAACDVCQPEP